MITCNCDCVSFWFWEFCEIHTWRIGCKTTRAAAAVHLVAAHACITHGRLQPACRSFYCNNPASFSSTHLFSVLTSLNRVSLPRGNSRLLTFSFFLIIFCFCVHVFFFFAVGCRVVFMSWLHRIVWERRVSLTPDGRLWVRRFIPRPKAAMM